MTHRSDAPAALILAGGTLAPELIPVADGATNRALIRVGARGETMLDIVVAAVQAGMPHGRILVAGDVPCPPGCEPVAGGASLLDTLLNGVAALHPGETRLLVATADAPFLTPDAVADFLARAAAAQPAQFVYPIVPAHLCAERFPEMKRTTLRLAEGTFTGGNLALLDPTFLRAHAAPIRAAYARRKNVPALALLLGANTVLRLLVSPALPSALRIRDVEAGVGRLLGGVTARAVITPFAETGADADKAEDICIARHVLQSEV